MTRHGPLVLVIEDWLSLARAGSLFPTSYLSRCVEIARPVPS
jgi:hypothetical protein